MDNNNTIPAELENQIDAEAVNKTMHLPTNTPFDIGYSQGVESGYIAGATAYATKYQQAKAFLQTLIHYQDAGIWPDITTYNEIKTFLDGSK